MRILLWHGYLLRGSGSNVYSANLAREWRAAGHDVLLLCQERAAAGLDFVDASGTFAADNRSFRSHTTIATPAPGRCEVVLPDIGGLLPVYVYDEYEGFEVKRFVDLNDEELDRYTESNVTALTTAIEQHRPDAIIVGHEVMGPAIARRACDGTGHEYAVLLHGSALEYAVKVQERYVSYAQEGLGSAKVVVGGSRYMIEAAAAAVEGWRERGVVVNPGCDVELFAPAVRDEPSVLTIGYVGKLMAPKGVHNLIAALGLLHSENVRAVIVGYGGFETGLHDLAQSLRDGDLSKAREIAAVGEMGPLPDLVSFLETLPGAAESYLDKISAIPIEFTGRLEHDKLSPLLPTMDVLVVPSVLPEAFGMVAAEAAASGVLPVVPAHSGIAEAGKAVEEAIGAPGLLTFDPSDPIRGIAAAVDRVLSLPWDRRAGMRLKAAQLAHERWSWTHVADSLLAVSTARS